MTVTSLEDLYANPAPGKGEGQPSSDPASVAAQPESPAPETPPAEAGQGDPSPAASQPPASSGAPPAPSIDDLPKDVQGLQAALKAERQKRQEYGTKATDFEKQLAAERQRATEYEQLLRRMSTPQPAQPQPQAKPQRPAPPDPFTDPDQAFAYERQMVAEALQHRDDAIFETRVLMSQELMRTKHTDYDEVEAIFAEVKDQDPELQRQLRLHPMPAKFAYEVGKRIKLDRDMGNDPDAYIQRKIAEALAAKEAEKPSPPSQLQVPTVPTRQAPPQSLASMPSTGPRSRLAFNGPTPLADLYK